MLRPILRWHSISLFLIPSLYRRMHDRVHRCHDTTQNKKCTFGWWCYCCRRRHAVYLIRIIILHLQGYPSSNRDMILLLLVVEQWFPLVNYCCHIDPGIWIPSKDCGSVTHTSFTMRICISQQTVARWRVVCVCSLNRATFGKYNDTGIRETNDQIICEILDTEWYLGWYNKMQTGFHINHKLIS